MVNGYVQMICVNSSSLLLLVLEGSKSETEQCRKIIQPRDPARLPSLFTSRLRQAYTRLSEKAHSRGYIVGMDSRSLDQIAILTIIIIMTYLS